jgi:hypothetical protein
MWRDVALGYDMPPPISPRNSTACGSSPTSYVSLHAYVRWKLAEMEKTWCGGLSRSPRICLETWSQMEQYHPLWRRRTWNQVRCVRGVARENVDARGMVHMPRIFQMLGFEPLPETFWGARSLASRPRVVCPRQRLEHREG